MSAGQLIGVVGPSGVGKDSVMQALSRAAPDVHLVRRVITRPSGAEGEAFERVNETEFASRRDAGDFVLHWRAHGLHYGIPVSEIAPLDLGGTCLVNLSRGVLAEADARFEAFTTLHLTASPHVLATRLRGRGRETGEEIAKRLSRAGFGLPLGLRGVINISNDGPLEETVAKTLKALQIERV